ncbi:MAG TPA: hypothetical protein VH184_21635 [Dongiaceae bacterium]|jgi:hypothetical protein|nr:hypothetical protein [Dongiaceae bacterium]
MVWKILPPAHVPVLGGAPSDEERRAAQRHNLDQLALRLAALFKHYGIDPGSADADSVVVLRLAQDFVPGFEIRSIAKRERGRPKKWDVLRAARLLADVARLTKRGASAQNACRILATRRRFAARYGQENPDSLYARYKESLRIVRADRLLGRMVAEVEAPGYLPDGWSLDDWFIYVFSNRDE